MAVISWFRSTSGRWRQIALVAAIALLNASLTFENIWPTLAIRWVGGVSVELAVCVLALIAMRRLWGSASRWALRALTTLWLLLVAGRYADVTAPALFGREINLYWDLRFIPDVVALLAKATRIWLVLAAVGATLTIIFLLYTLFRWAVGRVTDALEHPVERRVLGLVAAGVVVLFAAQGVGLPAVPVFAAPVTQTYARQVRVVVNAVTRSTSIPASPVMDSDLSRVAGADVYLIFLESYGAVSWDRPSFVTRLAASRAELDASIAATHREVVSAYVESPTFGGSSWLAHISLMSGIEVRDPGTNAGLMTQKRDTLVTTFAKGGFRTVALMPGLWQGWPEGAFYGFDEIYGGPRLDYRGPEFGWFGMTDQFALARFDAVEASRASRPPIFMFFPTISTHTPFTPTPPYQPDWPRMLTETPYDAADLDRAMAQEADWMNLGPGYADAMAYGYETLAGYIRAHADRDFVLIVLGDHQPPALVSGEGAPWDVPVHVIASRRPVLERLLARGFKTGLRPARPIQGKMHALLPTLLEAFGDPRAATTAARSADQPAPLHTP